ncbi:hypothetical protein LB507_008920 [Fusarium sp. FIESC RH6]|nr:hypothetical protein LB507_008920 [Fusarium sp. FIESC RH6]
MSLETRSEPVRLRDKIDAALQNVRPEQSPKTAFIEVWQVVQSDYETMRHIVHQYISRLLDEKRVRATVASRTKTVESISKSINRRDDAEAKEQKQKFRSPQDIFDDLHDLVGLRVVVDYPSGLDKSFHLIEESFQIKMFNSFSSDRAVGQQWKPKFGAYETRNYLLRPGSSIDLATYAGVLFEIQVTTMAESLYNKLAHPLLYKASQGGLSRKDEMIIDMGHGAALLYWITVACVEERLEGNFDETVQTSKFPQSVRHLAGHEGTVTNLDAVVNATPDFPSTSKDSTSIDFLLKSLADIRLTDTPDEDIWDRIRVKIGLDQHQILGSLPTVPEARCDSKDFEDSPKCHRKTRKEVRNVITGWLDDSQAETLFWLHAPAEVGKTTLARTLVDDLRALQLAAGYFFRRGHELRNDTSRVFPTIASQLTRTIPSFANALRLSIGTFNIESMDKLALREQFNTLIYNPLRSIKHMPKNMLIIIDALDECKKPNDIQLMLELFAQLKDLEGFRVRVFFSSRNTRSVNNAFLKVTYREMALHEQFLDATRLEMKTVLEDGLGEIKRLRNVKQESWPSAEDFNTILHYATSPSPLFIYTSTLLRHIDGRDPKKRLQRWLERSRNSVSQLDHIYDPIMKSILAGDGDDDIQEPLDQAEIQSLQLIVGSLLLLARPLSANDLRNLLEMDEGRFQTTLRSLHAVLHAPDDKCPINLIHKSFADYILGIGDDVTGTARIDPLQIHEHLARQCINHMRGGLQKNICNVDSPLTLAREFDQDRVTKFIPPELAYACNHWIHHLQRGPEALDLVGPFLKQHLLHWLEALSILGEQLLGEGGIAIRNLVSLTQVCVLVDPYRINILTL